MAENRKLGKENCSMKIVLFSRIKLVYVIALKYFVYAGQHPHETCVITKKKYISIQLMHSFKVNIRICQTGNSDVNQGKAQVNITFEV